ncbi:MAG: hypothetical protein ACKO3G_07030 [Planctomycetaceae bacterium]
MPADDNETDAWKAFCDELQQLISESESTQDLVNRFANRTVEWTGTVNSIAFDNLSNNVDIDLPEVIVTLSDGKRVPLDGVCLSVNQGQTRSWQNFRPGESLKFRATFLGNESVFPCCEVKRLKSGPVLIVLGLHDAEPVCCIP